MLSQALYSQASSSIATYQHVLEPLGPWSPEKVSLNLNSAHLEMDVTVLNWWVLGVANKSGHGCKFFVHFTHILSSTLLCKFLNTHLHLRSMVWFSTAATDLHPTAD